MTRITPLEFHDMSDGEVEYYGPTDNQFGSIRYNKGDSIPAEDVEIRVEYGSGQENPILLRTPDGREIYHGDRVKMADVAKNNPIKSDRDKGRLKFLFDITNDKAPRLDWEPVQFFVYHNGSEIGQFSVNFGGYPKIDRDYNPETGEYEL